jgi:hypothetical protein
MEGTVSHLVPFTANVVASPVPGCQAWRLGACLVIAGIEQGRWHLSISHRHRYPSWDEIREARYRFVPDDVMMAMLLPPRSEYVNIHPNCFHLHEIDGEAGGIR